MPPPLNVAIVAHNAYGAMTGGREGHVGGVERQTSLMSRWLAARGHRVSLLTWDEGQGDEVVIDGVRVISICRQGAGLPVLKFFTPRWSGLSRALDRADADVCYHNGAEYVTGQVARWCRRKRRAFVFSVASDMDVAPNLPELTKVRERVLYSHGLRNADRIVVQTSTQRRSLRQHFGLDAQVMEMPCPGPGADDFRPRELSSTTHPAVLWAGRIAPVKRLELLLDVAEVLPDVQFRIAGMPYKGDPYSEKILERARGIANVVLLGMVPREAMGEQYRDATLLCCTSQYEGFPNTFIEAWSHGLPVISTVDPDSLLTTCGLGAQGSTREALAAAIAAMVREPAKWLQTSRRAREYYLERHSVDAAMLRFEGLFRAVTADRERVGR